MGEIVDNAIVSGMRLHKWNVWESISPCPESKHLNGKGCETCPISQACLAKAEDYYFEFGKELKTGIAALGTGLFDINDAIKVYSKDASKRTWETEYECRRPSANGLIYPDFDPDKNVIDIAPKDLRIYRAVDWGYNNFVCLWIGVDNKGDVYVLDTVRSEQSSIKANADLVKEKKYNVINTYCDPAGKAKNDQTGKSNIMLFGEFGIPCDYTTNSKWRNVQNGIQLVDSKILSADGKRHLFVVKKPSNQMFIKAMTNYMCRKVNEEYIQWTPKDPQEYEHIPDALRYGIVNIFKPKTFHDGTFGIK